MKQDRRQFLKTSAFMAAALAAPSFTLSGASKKNGKIISKNETNLDSIRFTTETYIHNFGFLKKNHTRSTYPDRV